MITHYHNCITNLLGSFSRKRKSQSCLVPPHTWEWVELVIYSEDKMKVSDDIMTIILEISDSNLTFKIDHRKMDNVYEWCWWHGAKVLKLIIWGCFWATHMIQSMTRIPSPMCLSLFGHHQDTFLGHRRTKGKCHKDQNSFNGTVSIKTRKTRTIITES